MITMKKAIMGLMMLGVLVLPACGSSNDNESPVLERPTVSTTMSSATNDNAEPSIFIHEVDYYQQFVEFLRRFPSATESSQTIHQGGTLNIGLVRDPRDANDSGMLGRIHPLIATTRADSIVSQIVTPSLYPMDQQGRIIFGDNHNSPVIIDFDIETNTKTLTMRDGVYLFWGDGVPLTFDALVMNYYYLATIRFVIRQTDYWVNVVGLYDFRYGNADHIAGLTLSDEGRTLTIRYTHFLPTMAYDFYMSFPFARHRSTAFFDNNVINFDVLTGQLMVETSIGYGAFLVEEIVPNDRISLIANENYWQGRPYLDRIVFHCVTPNEAVNMLRSGALDIIDVYCFNLSEVNDDDNIVVLGNFSNTQQMLYFNLGVMRDMSPGQQVGVPEHRPRTDEHPIMDVQFRRAIAFAIDQHAILRAMNSDVHTLATSVLHPFNAYDWINFSSPGLARHDLSIANEILDAAGYRWGNDGFRLDAYGNSIYLNLAMVQTGTSQRVFDSVQASLKEIGIELRHFSVLPNSNWMERSMIITQSQNRNNNHPMHLFIQELEVSPFPNPSHGVLSPWGLSINNLGAFVNDEAQRIFDDINSYQSFDSVFIEDAYQRWEALFNEYIPAIPLLWRMDLQAVNRRVVNYIGVRGQFHDDAVAWHRVGLLGD